MDARYVGRCPRCGGRVLDAGRLYACENAMAREKKGQAACNWRLWKVFRRCAITEGALGRLLAGDEVVIECATESGDAYRLTVFLDPDRNFALYPVRRVVGECPACGGRLLESDRVVRCENNRTHQVGGRWVNDGTCSFRVQKDINGVRLSTAEIARLASGEEVFLRGLAGKGGRKLDAWMRLDRRDGFKPAFRLDGKGDPSGD